MLKCHVDCYGIFSNKYGFTVPNTRSTPHETRESNAMRTRHNIAIVHYELDRSGNPVSIDYYPGSIDGKLSHTYRKE